MPMLSFDNQEGHFHVRTIAVCIHNDCVLIHQTPGHALWSLPGGRVDMGESSEEALVREMAEELKTRVRIQRLMATLELIDTDFNGQLFHEIGLYYAVELPDVTWQAEPFRGPEQHNPADFWWCPRAQLNDVSLVPATIKRMVLAPHDTYRHMHSSHQHYTEITHTIINTSLSK
jgi:ADP-ribose pyrophosphatase YjhB (NUDIX family)